MIKNKRDQYSESKVPRTHGWHSQIEFDNILSDLDFSSLRFLNHRYIKEIYDFPSHFDLNDGETQKEYQFLLQRKKMITEELDHRMMDTLASPSYQDRGLYFDIDTGLVLDKDSNIVDSVAYNKDYTDIVHSDINQSTNTNVAEQDDETNYEYYKPKGKEKYRNWNYWKDD